jgi:tight adherence protein C
MNLIIFIMLAGLLAIIIFLIITEEGEEDPLKRRLRQFTAKTQEENPTEIEEKNVDFKLATNIIKLFEPIISLVYNRFDSKPAKVLLLEAGLGSSDEDVYRFISTKVVYACLGAIIAIFLAISPDVKVILKLLLIIVIPLCLYRMPDFKVKRLARIKFEEITYNLPDALDLLTICVEAGLGLDSAFVRVSQEIVRTCPILSKEFNRVSKDIMSGLSRSDAFRNLSLRNNVPDLRSFVALLIQTDKLGTSIAQSLRVYSDTMRTKRRQRAEKLAAQASVKMVIPLALFVMPSMFVILLTPAVISLIENFKHAN